MSKTYLKSLSLEGFRSFVQTSEIQFPKSGLLLVRGKNTVTGVGSGTGKSSLNLAIADGLGFCPYPSTETDSWKWLNPPEKRVTLGFESDGHSFMLTRTKGSRLLAKDCEKYISVAKAVNQELETLFGMNATLLEAVTFRHQGGKGVFLLRPDLEKKAFLSEILELEPFEAAYEKSQVAIQAAQSVVNTLQASYSEAKATFEENTAAYMRLKKAGPIGLTTDALKEEQAEIEPILQSISAQLNKSIQDIAKWTGGPKIQEFKDKLAGCREYIALQSADDREAANEGITLRNEISKQLKDVRQRLAKKPQIQADYRATVQLIESMEAKRCYVCEQSWNIQDDLEKLQTLKAKQAKLTQAIKELPLDSEIKDLEAQLEAIPLPIESEAVAELRAAEEKLEARIRKLEDELASTKQQRTQMALEGAEVAASGHRSRLKEINSAILAITTRNNELKSAEKLVQQSATTTTSVLAKLEEAKATLNVERDFSRMVGREGFLGDIFDEVLADISEQTNDILSSVANTQNIVLRFISESTTNKGTVQRSIKALVCIDGNEIPLKSGLSGGMLVAVDLAVDIALGRVISQRKGSFPNWLVLDESFNGLCPLSKKTCIEILQKQAEDRLIIVIDHCQELQAYFDQIIEIEYDNQTSTIKKVTTNS